MRYRSTRGGVEDCGFVDAVLMGLAPDRGLLVPKEIPKVDAATAHCGRVLAPWSDAVLHELSCTSERRICKVASRFLGDTVHTRRYPTSLQSSVLRR